MTKRLAVTILLLLFVSSGLRAEETYTDNRKGYSLSSSQSWKRTEYPTPVDLALACDISVCGPDTRFTTNANYVAQFASSSTTDFIKDVPADLVTQTVRQIVGALGTVTVVEAPKIRKVGSIDGYVGLYKLAYIDGRTRDFAYAITFNRGHLYHLQFFTPAGSFAKNSTEFESLLSGFRVTR
jgi:hypothetical protein